MLIPSLSVAPVAPVFFALSDPAKSTNTNFAVINPSYIVDSSLSVNGCCSMNIENMAWDLEEASFIIVAAVVLW